MAINSIVIKQNLYNPFLENLDPTDLLHRGMQGEFSNDAVTKLVGRAQYIVTFNTTDNTGNEVYFSIGNAVNTRTVNDHTSSPSNQLQITLPGVDVTTVGGVRKITLEIEQNGAAGAGVRNFAKAVGVFRNAATPTQQTAFVVTEGALGSTSAIGATTFAAGQINFSATGIAATSINWQVKITVDDLRLPN